MNIREHEQLAAYKHIWKKLRRAERKLAAADKAHDRLQNTNQERSRQVTELRKKADALKADCMAKGLRIKALEDFIEATTSNTNATPPEGLTYNDYVYRTMGPQTEPKEGLL